MPHVVVGIVSAGAMGSAVGAAYAASGHRVVTAVAGRSERTRGLAETAGLQLVPTLDDVVAAADLVLSIAPPGEAERIAADLAAAAGRTGARPLVSDWNAVAPATVRRIGATLADAELELVDGSISGGPPRADYRTRVYLSGRRADELAAESPSWLDVRVVGPEAGLASAVKMCTASVYKGFTALLTHALVTADAHGVLAQVLDDLHDSFPRQLERAARVVAVSATKAERYVAEMREIASTQASAGLSPALFEAFAEAHEAIATTPAGLGAPEEVGDPELEDVLSRLRAATGGNASVVHSEEVAT
jgi:3-hydroxyisobutyrate dehydrogenase-like beta-hydroxyacid dehydrogenase